MYLLRDMPIVMCIYLIQIHTFLLFNVLKREVSNVFLYIWTINYSYSYSFYLSCPLILNDHTLFTSLFISISLPLPVPVSLLLFLTLHLSLPHTIYLTTTLYPGAASHLLHPKTSCSPIKLNILTLSPFNRYNT